MTIYFSYTAVLKDGKIVSLTQSSPPRPPGDNEIPLTQKEYDLLRLSNMSVITGIIFLKRVQKKMDRKMRKLGNQNE